MFKLRSLPVLLSRFIITLLCQLWTNPEQYRQTLPTCNTAGGTALKEQNGRRKMMNNEKTRNEIPTAMCGPPDIASGKL